MLTGLVDFNGKTCVFKLDKESFTLTIEDIEEREKLPSLIEAFMPIVERTEAIKDYETLIAKDFEKSKIIHFHINSLRAVGHKTHLASLKSYIIFDGSETSFDSLQIRANELDWFHDIGIALHQYKNYEDGEGELLLSDFDKTTEEFEFTISDKLIKGNLSISREVTRQSQNPLILNSNLDYRFEETTDISLASDLVSLTRDLLKFISYRKNSHINKLILKNHFDHEYYSIGELHIRNIQTEEKEKESVIRERIIAYPLLSSSFTKLLEKVSMKEVYLRHIPEDFKSNNTIIPARFIMATAGFEWQFEISHKIKSEENKMKYEKERNEVLEFLEGKYKETTGKEKKFFKNSKRLFEENPSQLAANIIWALKKSDDVLKDFIRSMYKMNEIPEEIFKHAAIAQRIAKYRNAFAHGNLDLEFNRLIIFDLPVLEWLYYAMILEDIGVSTENAKKSINNLFDLNFNYQ